METVFPDNSRIISVVCCNKLACITVWNPINDYDIEVSIVSWNPIWRTKLDDLLSYPFQKLNYPRITARIKASNHKSINLVEKLGFKKEGTMREASAGEDVYIYGLLRREYYGET